MPVDDASQSVTDTPTCIPSYWQNRAETHNETQLFSWGDWRCNALAFAGMVSAGRYAARLDPEEREPVIESAFFVALVAQGFGTISGEIANYLSPCLPVLFHLHVVFDNVCPCNRLFLLIATLRLVYVCPDALFRHVARLSLGVGQQITSKGFSDLSADAGDLALKGDYGGAAANMILNTATAGVALLARLKAEKVFLQEPAT